MNRTGKLLASTMIAAAGAVSTALALSATAAAEPAAPAPARRIPGLQLLSQLSNVQAAAPQLMQSIASALSGTPGYAGHAGSALPLAPPRRSTLPQPPALRHAATPAAAPATAATAPANLLSPLLSALPDQLANPAGLAQLLPSGISLPGLAPRGHCNHHQGTARGTRRQRHPPLRRPRQHPSYRARHRLVPHDALLSALP